MSILTRTNENCLALNGARSRKRIHIFDCRVYVFIFNFKSPESTDFACEWFLHFPFTVFDVPGTSYSWDPQITSKTSSNSRSILSSRWDSRNAWSSSYTLDKFRERQDDSNWIGCHVKVSASSHALSTPEGLQASVWKVDTNSSIYSDSLRLTWPIFLIHNIYFREIAASENVQRIMKRSPSSCTNIVKIVSIDEWFVTGCNKW